MYRKALIAVFIATSVSGCVSSLQPRPVELKDYEVSKDSQIQLVASDLAVELSVRGIEWNKTLRPWNYKTLRSRTINISQKDPQKAFFELFADTGLLPYYDKNTNRVYVEPYKSKLKETYNFEPSFTRAADSANSLSIKSQLEGVEKGTVREFQIYKGMSLKENLSSWAKEGGYQDVIWYISDPKQKKLLLRKNKATMEIAERSPILAIKAMLDSINNTNQAKPINFRVDTSSSTLVFHGMEKNEPFKIFSVDATNTKDVIVKLAREYKSKVIYDAPIYEVAKPYKTIITNRVQRTFNEVMAGYPLHIVYEESTNTVRVTK